LSEVKEYPSFSNQYSQYQIWIAFLYCLKTLFYSLLILISVLIFIGIEPYGKIGDKELEPGSPNSINITSTYSFNGKLSFVEVSKLFNRLYIWKANFCFDGSLIFYK